MAGLAVLLSGSGSNLAAIMENELPVNFVMSDNPKAYGIERAEKKKIQTYVQPSLKGLELHVTKLCSSSDIELIVLAGFMRLLSPGFVEAWKGKIINIHPALLPSFPGAHAIEQAFEHGVKYTGVTVHYVDEGMDTGQIIAQEPVKIAKNDTIQNLYGKIHKVEHKLYPKVIKDLLK
jgi:phosphoribosylglycinamide formyltransferase-1